MTTDHIPEVGKMMPEALQLADELVSMWDKGYIEREDIEEAAAELRRLHAENEALKAAQYECGLGAGCCYQAVKSEADEVLLQQALDTLEWVEPSGTTGHGGIEARKQTIAALKERLQ